MSELGKSENSSAKKRCYVARVRSACVEPTALPFRSLAMADQALVEKGLDHTLGTDMEGTLADPVKIRQWQVKLALRIATACAPKCDGNAPVVK